MKQGDNYKSKYAPHSFSDTRDSPDSYWKYSQKKNQSVPLGRSSRNPSMEPVTSYYSSSNSYKPQKSHVCPTYSKYTSPHSQDVSHHGLQSHVKPGRDKYYCPTSSTTRKTRYDDELGNNDKLKYIHEELETFTEDNAEEDAQEEEDDREEAGEFLDKDYEEQEADDETGEESDAPPQIHRAGRGGKKETLLRQQRWRAMEQQEDPRRFRCQQHVASNQGPSSSTKYYHGVAEHDVPEPLSEEDFVPTSLKSSTRRSPADYHQWSPARCESDRYDANLPIRSRRARTKPEMDQLIEPEFTKPRKCNRCGSVSSKKTELPVKNGCRFDDRMCFLTKGPIGDEPESHEQMYCGRCNFRYNVKDVSDNSPALYSAKPRRSRDTKSPTIYEVPEQGQLDKLSSDYSRSSSKYHRKTADAFPEKVKRSLHGTARVSPRHAE